VSPGRSLPGGRRVAGLLLCLCAVAGCSAGAARAVQDGGPAAASGAAASAEPGEPPATGSAATPPTAFSTGPVRVESRRSGRLVSVTTGSSGGVDRLVFRFAGPAPGVTVERVPRVTTGSTNEPDGDVVEVAGQGFLSVRFTSTTPNTGGAISPGVPTNADLHLPLLRSVVLVHDVGGDLRFGVGVTTADPEFRVVAEPDPTRLVVELRKR
jgi:hypothetical protein